MYSGRTRREAQVRLNRAIFHSCAAAVASLLWAHCVFATRGLFIEGINNYSLVGQPNLSQSVNAATEFYNQMNQVTTDTYSIWWNKNDFWLDDQACDTDLLDDAIVGVGQDSAWFDRSGGIAVSFWQGHGSCDDQTAHPTTCTSRAQCPNWNGYVGVCTRRPKATSGTCEYSLPRRLVTSSTLDQFGHYAFYNLMALGESTSSGGWAGFGTNGGTNLAVIHSSCGATPGLYFETLKHLFAGIHIVATMAPADKNSDTADTADYGYILARSYMANPLGSVANAWNNVVNSADSGNTNCRFADGTTTPAHGFTYLTGSSGSGCGCVIAAADEESDYWATWAVTAENWRDLQSDNNDALAGSNYAVAYLCNWDSVRYPAILP